jgi:hypothetical protein
VFQIVAAGLVLQFNTLQCQQSVLQEITTVFLQLKKTDITAILYF